MPERTRTPPIYSPNDSDKRALRLVQDCVTEGKRWHNDFCRRVERRYDAWRGLQPENAGKPKGWRSNQHPPYLINIVEGMLSSIEDANPRWTSIPRPLPGMDSREMADMADGADFVSALIEHQMRCDNFARKGSALAHQDLIAGLSPAKIYWLKKVSSRRQLEEVQQLVFDETGGTIDLANHLQENEREIVLRDDPTMEVRDVRDFMYPESATSVEAAPWLIDRTYVTFETLQRLQDLGVYRNVEFVRETRMDESNAPDPGGGETRESRLRGADRTRGLVEIVERWTDETVYTVANQSVVLRTDENPLFRGKKPFLVVSAIPDLFQVPGVSVIEGLASMQEMLWTLMNLRLDATRIAASVITMIRGDVDNPEEYEWAPEAQWIVPDPNAVRTLDMSAVANAAAATLQAEGLLRGDIQNVMGGLPFTGSAQSQTQSVDTATGVSIVTNIAQAILARRKSMYTRAYEQAAQMFLELDQYLLREQRLVEILGPSGERRYLEVHPVDIQGVYDIQFEVDDDSQLRQERRAEKQALLTMALQGAPVMAQFGGGVTLNLQAFWDELLDAYRIPNKPKFYSTPQQSMQAAAPAGTAAPGAASPPGAATLLDQLAGGGGSPGGGITNPSLAAGPTAPSSPVSMSAAAPMSRALARTGAGRSA